MIQHGAKPQIHWPWQKDHLKSFGSVDTSTLPTSLNLDGGLWMPDQEIGENYNGLFVPALPFGCTDWASTDVCCDQDGVMHDPENVENITHANASNGGSIPGALQAAAGLYKKTGPYAVRQNPPFDWFDSIRVSLVGSADQKLTISIGTPYFSEWATTPSTGIMPEPQSYSSLGLPWHNAKIAGFVTINGSPYLIYKSWQGAGFGDKGFGYMSRTLVNNVMSIAGTCAYTLPAVAPPDTQTIDWNVVEFLISLVRNLLA